LKNFHLIVLILLLFILAKYLQKRFTNRRNFVCDGDDKSPPLVKVSPLVKVVVTVTTTFSKWNLQFFRLYKNTNFSLHFGVWARESYFSCYQKRSVA